MSVRLSINRNWTDEEVMRVLFFALLLTNDSRFLVPLTLLTRPHCLSHYMHSPRSRHWTTKGLPVTYSPFLSFFRQTCEDFLVECRFAGQVFPCFQKHDFLTWTTTTSHFGACCSFHYHPLTENFQPFAANKFGSEGALTIIGSGYPLIADGQSGIMYSSGFLVSEAVERN